jgi:hypothetical protein
MSFLKKALGVAANLSPAARTLQGKAPTGGLLGALKNRQKNQQGGQDSGGLLDSLMNEVAQKKSMDAGKAGSLSPAPKPEVPGQPMKGEPGVPEVPGMPNAAAGEFGKPGSGMDQAPAGGEVPGGDFAEEPPGSTEGEMKVGTTGAAKGQQLVWSKGRWVLKSDFEAANKGFNTPGPTTQPSLAAGASVPGYGKPTGF